MQHTSLNQGHQHANNLVRRQMRILEHNPVAAGNSPRKESRDVPKGAGVAGGYVGSEQGLGVALAAEVEVDE